MRVYLNPLIDTLYFGPFANEFAFAKFIPYVKTEDLNSLKRLAIHEMHLATWRDGPPWIRFPTIGGCTSKILAGLERLMIGVEIESEGYRNTAKLQPQDWPGWRFGGGPRTAEDDLTLAGASPGLLMSAHSWDGHLFHVASDGMAAPYPGSIPFSASIDGQPRHKVYKYYYPPDPDRLGLRKKRPEYYLNSTVQLSRYGYVATWYRIVYWTVARADFRVRRIFEMHKRENSENLEVWEPPRVASFVRPAGSFLTWKECLEPVYDIEWSSQEAFERSASPITLVPQWPTAFLDAKKEDPAIDVDLYNAYDAEMWTALDGGYRNELHGAGNIRLCKNFDHRNFKLAGQLPLLFESMDPLTALSLAGNVIQFVDFARKLLSQGYELYKSTSGQLAADEELELVTSDLRDVIHKIQKANVTTSVVLSTQATVNDSEQKRPSFENICAKAAEIAQTILTKLDGFKLDSKLKPSKDRKGETFRKFCKRVWSGDELHQLEKRLNTLKDAIDREVLVTIMQSLSSHNIHMSNVFERLDQQTQLILSALFHHECRMSQELGTTVARLLSRHEMFSINEHRTPDLTARSSTSDLGSQSTITRSVEMLTVSNAQESSLRLSVQKAILASLRFPTMSNRYESLLDAHPGTFEWAFKKDENNLATWLKTGTGIYWISGKPGSGKSTLMKHIYDDKRTSQYLREWTKIGSTEDIPLTIATFFFWNSGSPEQRSQLGMLRSLLFQILDQHLDLIPVVFPEIWAKLYTLAIAQARYEWSEWSIGRLIAAFKDTLAQKVMNVKLCLLIDGLDEFDGDHEILADLFNEVARPSQVNVEVKICVSSRPWVVYKENFGQGPSLQLQTLTYKDIEWYVTDRFNANSAFKRLAAQDLKTARMLQKEIITKAEGVFIWVHIVVRDLLRAMRNRDSIRELWERVQALPRDIEPLYDHIMSQIEPFYMAWSSKIFQIVRALLELGSTPRAKAVTGDGFTTGFTVAKDNFRGGCPSIANIYFAIDEALDFESVGRISEAQLNSKCEETEIRIAARCACLLEVRNNDLQGGVTSSSLVQYLHRTARDFIEKPSRWSNVLRHTQDISFDPYWHLMRSDSFTLQRFSFEEQFIAFPPDEQILDTATRILIFASYADAHMDSHEEQAAILEATAQTLIRHEISLVDWPMSIKDHRIPQELRNPFLSAALSLNLSGYISKKLRTLQRRNPVAARFSANYMLYYMDTSNLISIDGFPRMSYEMTSTLIASGADVNYKYEASWSKKTTWQLFLERSIPDYARDNYDGTEPGDMTDPGFVPLLKLFLLAGADTPVLVDGGHNMSHSITLIDYFQKSDEIDQSTDNSRIRRQSRPERLLIFIVIVTTF
ncbi:hypothetical protein EG329_014179 [Mollisiaceae sp. DMI_Dod_QoI]|nr:hypothetical protein EG329_014179 [Helotiales sp. DMI_Dod_QoI]